MQKLGSRIRSLISRLNGWSQLSWTELQECVYLISQEGRQLQLDRLPVELVKRGEGKVYTQWLDVYPPPDYPGNQPHSIAVRRVETKKRTDHWLRGELPWVTYQATPGDLQKALGDLHDWLRWIDEQPAAPAETPTETTADAYVSVSAVYPERFQTYKVCKKFLDANRDKIRTRKPSKQRLEVHAGDWVRYWKAKESEAFAAIDTDEEAVQALLAAAAERKAQIDERRRQGK